MSLAVNPAFPPISFVPIIVGGAFSEISSFIVQRPVFGAVWQKAQTATHPKEVLEAKESQTAVASFTTSAIASVIQSYGVSALLHLTNVVSYKGAAVVGGLLFAAQSGPQIVYNIFVAKAPVDVILSTVVVKLLNTVGLSLALQGYNQNFGSAVVQEINKLQ